LETSKDFKVNYCKDLVASSKEAAFKVAFKVAYMGVSYMGGYLVAFAVIAYKVESLVAFIITFTIAFRSFQFIFSYYLIHQLILPNSYSDCRFNAIMVEVMTLKLTIFGFGLFT
jgi:hypothetical protein